MQYVLALGLLVTLCASADAATVHHYKQRHVVLRGINPGFTPFRRAWAYAPARAPVYYHDTPSYNDPSKFGGQTPY